jgi:hypothetical protein
MSAILHVYDETPGSKRTLAGTVTLNSQRVKAREVVRRRVEEEVKEYNRWKEGLFQGLVQPENSKRVVNGEMVHYELEEGRAIDLQRQLSVAMEAFDAHGFNLLFDDHEVGGPDEEVVLTGNNTATFVKVVPLIGG